MTSRITRLRGTLAVVLASSAVLFVLGHHARADETSRGAECVSVADDAERLACYDRAFLRGAGQPASQSAVPATMAADVAAADAGQAAVTADTVADFGAEDLAASEPTKPQQELDSIESRVAEVRRDRRGKHVYVLENGQTWRQLEGTDIVPLKVDETARIWRGTFDSYLMRGSSGGRTVKVRRVD